MQSHVFLGHGVYVTQKCYSISITSYSVSKTTKAYIYKYKSKTGVSPDSRDDKPRP